MTHSYRKVNSKIIKTVEYEVSMNDIDFHIAQVEAELSKLKTERVRMNTAPIEVINK